MGRGGDVARVGRDDDGMRAALLDAAAQQDPEPLGLDLQLAEILVVHDARQLVDDGADLLDLHGVAPVSRAAAGRHARSRYRPLRVSTRTLSPAFTNSGAWTTAPVSSVMGFVPPLAVSP